MSDQWVIEPGGQAAGELTVPGDKSVSHRSVMLGGLAEGVTHVSGFLPGEDCLATMRAFRAMGVNIEQPAETELVIHGVGMHGLQAPGEPVDLGNSGTAMRLMAGLLSAQVFPTVLQGDESLSGRPMGRIIKPLAEMGADVRGDNDRPPLNITPTGGLRAIEYQAPIASAQVKSAILLAGLYAEGTTVVHEPAVTRDHSERMLRAFGVNVESNDLTVSMQGGQVLKACDVQVPADLSSAAFPLGAALLAEEGESLITAVGINPTRTGVLDIIRLLGGEAELSNERVVGDEPIADLRVRASALKGCDIPPELVPLAIDEFPLVFALAACAEGQTRITGAEELRAKESDRIAAMADGLRKLGVQVEEYPDGALITGGVPTGGAIDSHDDHRIAMAFAVLARRASGPVQVLNTTNVATSFPGFVDLMASAGLRIAAQ